MTLIPFDYSGQQVRVINLHGEPWFVAKDVCEILDIRTDTLRYILDSDEVRSINPNSIGVAQTGGKDPLIVSEPGAYSLIARSRKPEAKPFKRWVNHEVLPSIRRTGSYGTPALSEDEIVHQALAITAKRVEALTATVEHQERRLRLVEPKAAAFDRWLSSNVNYAVDRVAKALRAAGAITGRNRLLDHMGTRKKDGGLEWIFRDARGQWTPFQAQVECGRLAVKFGSYEDSKTGEQVGTTTVRITPKGAARLAAVYNVSPETIADELERDADAA
ncbi:phage antirepressor Ant [Brooklawnia cerclae]|uniref:Prophage antirepressor-like protein n=1 Tax=Brooklawnia cerclae TaxID=349934 RepID=A0ABX0SJQ8_9ACTN|nr:phage antirepressor KilAC domain-containing protein [Brooklawnia cerclae]NIH57270.1 prophage antirepressor-like protein [Brooklawnia cerclae]